MSETDTETEILADISAETDPDTENFQSLVLCHTSLTPSPAPLCAFMFKTFHIFSILQQVLLIEFTLNQTITNSIIQMITLTEHSSYTK